MDLNSKSVEEKIRQYRVFKSCSQSTLMGLCEVVNHPMSQARLCALASGFSGESEAHLMKEPAVHSQEH